MNIVITLPTKLAHLIYEGTKTIEVRKSWPYDFDKLNDVVYVCEKGTGLVTGMFTISKLEASCNPGKTYKQYKDAICIDESWWNKYTEKAKEIYLWHIHHTEQFQKQYPLQKYFGVKKAPQSYVYTTADWFLNDSFLVEVEEPQETLISKGMCGEEKAVQ